MSLKDSKDAFLAQLCTLYGLIEQDLQVLPLRSKKEPKVVGYYQKMSQFRSNSKVIVRVHYDYIRACGLLPWEAEDEVRKTIANCYAHSMLEAIARLAAVGQPMGVPAWQAEFNGDANEFAEDFARLCITYDSFHEVFWERFMVDYAREHRRLFVTPEAA